jgi:uncharacterized membrane protein/protein-disulfide isomerase
MKNLSPYQIADRPRPPVRTAVAWLVRLLSFVATGLSGYLAWQSVQHGNVLGCSFGGVFDCDEVLSISWSKVLGVPVAILGTVVYVAIFLASWLLLVRNPRVARLGVGMLVLLSVAAAGAALWFTGVQLIQIGKVCPFCLAVHSCGLTIAALLAVELGFSCAAAREDAHPVVHLRSALAAGARSPRRVTPQAPVTGPSQFALPVVLGVMAVAAIVATQWLLPGPTNEVAHAGDLGGAVNLDEPMAPVNNPPLGESDGPDAHVVHRPPGASVDSANLGDVNDEDVGIPEEEQSLAIDTPPVNDEGFAATGEFDSDPEEANDGTTQTELNSEQPSATSTDSTSSRTVSIYNDQIKFDIYRQPYVGSPEAPHVVVELFDYTCKHCRKMHNLLERAMRRYRGDVVLVVMPVPMEASCNKQIRSARLQNRGSCKLARLALATAAARPSRFERFHYWLLDDDDTIPTYGRALVQAYDEFGRTDLRKELEDAALDDRIQRNINLYVNLASRWQGEKAFGLPVLILGDQISSGSVEFEDELFELIEDSLGAEPRM